MGELYLTYDDGPSAQTDALLDVLTQYDARATFFVIAPLARRYAGVIERMLAGGHRIGLHCCEHVRHTDRPATEVRADTQEGLAILGELGIRAELWRTPWGVRAPWTEVIAAEHGLTLVDWTHDTHDWRGDSAAEMLAVARPELRAGTIVLAHDGLGPGARRTDVTQTIALTERIGAHAATAGLSLSAIG